jgi:hypothetical protein
MGRVIPRALAVIGAALVVWSVSWDQWWTFTGGSTLFDDMTGRFGPYVGKWCSGVFCHDLDLTRLGGAFAKLGVATYFGGLAAAAAAVMTVLGGKQMATFARAAAGTAAVTLALALVLVAVRGGYRGADVELGMGLPLFAAGAIAIGVGSLWSARTRIELPVRPSPGRMMLGGAALLVVGALMTTSFWHWTWSDERNSVGLRKTERCWVHTGDRTICSTVESVDEIFMNDHEKTSHFQRSAEYTFDAGIAALIVAVLVIVAGPRRWLEHAHAVWIILLESAVATVIMTPYMSTGRDVHIGYGFWVVVVGCIAGITGQLLVVRAARAPRSPASPQPPPLARALPAPD